MRKQGFLADLFATVNNESWDLGRILSFLAMLPLFVSAGWNIWSGGTIDVSSLGIGIAAVVTACAVLIAAKDYTNTNAISQAAQDATAASSQAKQDETAAVVAEAVVDTAAAAASTPAGTEADPTLTIVVNEPEAPVPVTGKAKP